MKLSIILDSVENSYECTVVKPVNFDPEIMGIKLINISSKNSFREDCIYTSLEAGVKNYPSLILTSYEKDLSESRGGIIARVDEIFEIQNFITDLLADEKKQLSELKDLSLKAMESISFQESIDLSAQVLKNPIIVVDNAYKVIGKSTKYDVNDLLWRNVIENGHVPESLLIEMNKIVSKSNPNDLLAPFFVECDMSPTHKLAIKLTMDGDDIGYIVMFDQVTGINSMHWEILPQIAEVITKVLGKTFELGEFYGNSRDHILGTMIDGADRERIFTLMKIANISLPTKFTAIVAKMNENITEQEIRYYAEQIKETYPRVFYKHRGEYVYLIVPGNNGKERLGFIQEMAAKLNLLVMVSDYYEDFLQSASYLAICKRALEIAQIMKIKRNFNYSADFRFFSIINGFEDSDLIRYFESPQIATLKRYDQQNKTELLATLKCYLRCNRSLKHTSKELYIHRNTLFNRMQKIIDLTGIDLEDSSQMFDLELGVRIDKFNSAINSK